MSIIRFFVSLVGLLACAEAANARDVAVCGSSVGQAYFPAAALIAGMNKSGNWEEDNIRSGRITLSQADRGAFDILFTDGNQYTSSATRGGATVVPVAQNEFSLSVLVVYPLLTETLTFLRSRDGPEVIWTTNQHSTPIVKVGVYRAACKFVNLPRGE